MTEPWALVRAEKDEAWKRLQSLVLDTVSSAHPKRVYAQALDAFAQWYRATAAPGFSKATVQAYRSALEAAGLAVSSINVRLSAVKKLAAEAADNGWLPPEVAAGVARVKGAERHGVRAGNWLTLDQTEWLLALPHHETNKGRRDRALLALLAGCGLRRQELAGLRIEDVQQRDGRWCVVDLAGKGNRVRTVPMPSWTKAAAARFPCGLVLGAVNKGDRITGQGMSADHVSGNLERRRAKRQNDGAYRALMDVVLVWKYDRFTRSLSILIAALQQFSTLGIDFVSYTQNIDTTPAMGRLFYHMIGSLAEFEREMIVERVRAGLANARAKGKSLGRPRDRSPELRILDLRKQELSLRCAPNPPPNRHVWRTRIRNARNQ